MKRRELLKTVAAFGTMTAIPVPDAAESSARPDSFEGSAVFSQETSVAAVNPLHPPSSGSIPVAFVLSKGAVVIDYAGPWEVFQKAKVPGRSHAFRPYTVAESRAPMAVQFGGMEIIPEYTFENAPAPKVVVVPAQDGMSKAMLDWIRKHAKDADVTMSVCVGAFILAEAGLLSGKPATTFHLALGNLEQSFHDIQVKRGVRFVEAGNVATSAGLSAGMDLALRVVERYFGREAARQTAFYLEYQSEGWMNPGSNGAYK